DSMDVGVDCNSGLVECQRDHNVRRLSPDSRQFEKLVQVRRHLPARVFQQSFTNRVNCPCLYSIKRNRVDSFPNHTDWCGQHFLRRIRDNKQPFARGICGFVLRPKTEDARDQNSKWRFNVIADRRYGPLSALFSQDPDNFMNVFSTHQTGIQMTHSHYCDSTGRAVSVAEDTPLVLVSIDRNKIESLAIRDADQHSNPSRRSNEKVHRVDVRSRGTAGKRVAGTICAKSNRHLAGSIKESEWTTSDRRQD